MNSKKLTLLLLCTVLGYFSQAGNKKDKQNSPNFIIIMADDMGYGDISCFGNETVQTPNLDRLANEGVRFTDFHSNGAVCSPTRAALLTGLYQQRTGITGVVTAKKHRHAGLMLQETTFAEVAKEAGYTTGIFGKWHVGYDSKFNPIYQGFDEFIGFVSGNIDYQSHVDQEGYEDWWSADQLKKEKGYSTDLITDHAIEFIKSNKDKPFVLYVPHEAPHYPIQGRNSIADRPVGGKNGVDFTPGGSQPEEKRAALYKEMIEVMDEGVGNIVATLKKLKIDDNTIILFLSDNGGSSLADNGGLRGKKGSVWEGGHRVPAIAWSPNYIPQGVICNQTLITMDIFPTIADYIGIPSPKNLDGRSFRTILESGKIATPRPLYWEHGGQIAMRDGYWKWVRTTPSAEPQLYDLLHDKAEEVNIADKNVNRVKRMTAAVAQWQKEMKETASFILTAQ